MIEVTTMEEEEQQVAGTDSARDHHAISGSTLFYISRLLLRIHSFVNSFVVIHYNLCTQSRRGH